jgi:hypothetical protein
MELPIFSVILWYVDEYRSWAFVWLFQIDSVRLARPSKKMEYSATTIVDTIYLIPIVSFNNSET